MDLKLKGRKAIVTGASKGIGRAVAELLAEEGCDVGLCARGAGPLMEAVANLERRGVRAHGQALDVRDKAALEAWVKSSAEFLGGLDIVVANASALDMDTGEAGWRNEFEVDLLHTVRTVEAALPWLERSSAGAIVVISSISALEVDDSSPAYGTIKAALIHYAARLSYALAPRHIRVNTVSPGTTYFDGGVWQQVERSEPEAFRQALAQNPWGRMARPEEIADAVVYLASPRAGFITGANLVVDGAFTRRVQY